MEGSQIPLSVASEHTLVSFHLKPWSTPLLIHFDWLVNRHVILGERMTNKVIDTTDGSPNHHSLFNTSSIVMTA
jgi:hypothetical protein